LKRLKGLGVRIAVDDFGTGYSNLAYLKHFPIDTLKIDQSFIHNLAPSGFIDDRDRALLSAVIHLARALKLTVTAEGVEHQSQLSFLDQQDCDLVQGYLLRRPEPADQISRWLEKLVPSGTVVRPTSDGEQAS
jgi:EAL domain-containing protein (putative c-di-GMP-specific phosphodiesterase class I)